MLPMYRTTWSLSRSGTSPSYGCVKVLSFICPRAVQSVWVIVPVSIVVVEIVPGGVVCVGLSWSSPLNVLRILVVFSVLGEVEVSTSIVWTINSVGILLHVLEQIDDL